MAKNSNRPGKDPFVGLHFMVSIDSVEIAGFSECSGLSVETETMDYTEGGLNTYTHKLPVRTKYANITLKRGLDPGQDLYTWYIKSLDGVPNKRRNVSIHLYDSEQNEVRSWHLKEAFPVKWTGPDLKTDAGAVAVESVEIAHHGITPNAQK